MKSLDTLLFNETRLKVVMDAQPLTTIIRGAGKTLDNLEFYGEIFVN